MENKEETVNLDTVILLFGIIGLTTLVFGIRNDKILLGTGFFFLGLTGILIGVRRYYYSQQGCKKE